MTDIQVGDVFKGLPSFKFGQISSSATEYVRCETRIQVVAVANAPYVTNVIQGYDPVTGKANYVQTDKFAKVDETRPDALFVVESVVMRGGSEREMIANEPHVVARRLNAADGSYDSSEELITFVYIPKGGRSNFMGALHVEPIPELKKTRVVTFI